MTRRDLGHSVVGWACLAGLMAYPVCVAMGWVS